MGSQYLSCTARPRNKELTRKDRGRIQVAIGRSSERDENHSAKGCPAQRFRGTTIDLLRRFNDAASASRYAIFDYASLSDIRQIFMDSAPVDYPQETCRFSS